MKLSTLTNAALLLIPIIILNVTADEEATLSKDLHVQLNTI